MRIVPTRRGSWNWADLSRGKIVENQSLACAEAWPRTQLIWLVSLARAADRSILPLACSDEGEFRAAAYLPLPRKGAIVFVRSVHLRRFLRSVLPSIGNSTPFVLVTADYPSADLSLPSAALRPTEVAAVLAHPSLRGWWCTNTDHPAVHRLPLGVDYHDSALHGRMQPDITLRHLLHPLALYLPQLSPERQEAMLLGVARSLPSPASRPPHLAWADFHFDKRSRHRQQLFRRIERAPWLVVPPVRLSRTQLWQRKGQYLFDLSPPGHGVDCYRTWESLALGMIVIVQRGPLSVSVRGDGGLYHGLPIVLVDDFAREVSAQALRRWAAEHERRPKASRAEMLNRSAAAAVVLTTEIGGIEVPERLTLEFWLRRFRRALKRRTAPARPREAAGGGAQ